MKDNWNNFWQFPAHVGQYLYSHLGIIPAYVGNMVLAQVGQFLAMLGYFLLMQGA